MYKQERQLDFEDEPPDDEGSVSEESEQNEVEDDDSDVDQFEDALENLTLSEPAAVVAAAA
jgi:hypothetical protein